MCGNFNLMAIIAIPLGWLMWLCNAVLPIYALALLLFTILTRLILFPMSLKQHKSMAKMSALRPRIEAVQKQYANDKERLQQEQMKIYEQAKYNPLSGCLPTILQLVFLFGLINVIYNPLQHILQMPEATIAALKDKASAVAVSVGEDAARVETYDMYVITYKSMAEQAIADGRLEVNPFTQYNELVTEEVMERIDRFDMNLFGMFLGDTIQPPWPHTVSKTAVVDESGSPVLDENGKQTYNEVKAGWSFSWALLLPLLSGITAFLSGWLSTRMNPTGGDASQGGSMKAMIYIMPLFSVWIGFTVPSGVVLYWVYSNITMLVQSVVQYRFWSPAKLAADFEAELAEKEKSNKRRPKVVKVEAVNENGEVVTQEKTLSQKEADRIRLAEARRRDAEKYGEEYVEVTDEDLK